MNRNAPQDVRQSAVPVVPSVIRSREYLRARGVRLAPPSFAEPTALALIAEGVTYTMAQTAAWLDGFHFAVGRWDGTMSVFAWSAARDKGPVITVTVNSPSAEGVQMIVPLGGSNTVATSNDEDSIAIFSSPTGSWQDLTLSTLLRYPATLGVANSGQYVLTDGGAYLVVGHAGGFLSIWSDASGTWVLQQSCDLRNPNPVNPWGLHNIRGISVVFTDATYVYVATGSEDGFVSIVRVPDLAIMSQTVFNPAAQRGINSVAALGGLILVANCAVGVEDKNLWLYQLNDQSFAITTCDSVNLRLNQNAPQVFNFCSLLTPIGGVPGFLASTEEGALWQGYITPQNRFDVTGFSSIGGSLGSALTVNGAQLAAVNYNLYEFAIPTSAPR
jgi:hypothetical protein